MCFKAEQSLLQMFLKRKETAAHETDNWTGKLSTREKENESGLDFSCGVNSNTTSANSWLKPRGQTSLDCDLDLCHSRGQLQITLF